MLEKTLTKKIRKHLDKKLAHCKHMKVHGTAITKRGEPDIIAAGYLNHIPITLVIEAKIHPNQPTYAQIYRLKEWLFAGVHTAVIYSIEDLDLFLSEIAADPTFPDKHNFA